MRRNSETESDKKKTSGKKQKSLIARILAWFFILFLLGSLIAAGLSYYTYRALFAPGPAHGDAEKNSSIIWIKPGMGANQIGQELKRKQMIHNEDYFRYYVSATRKEGPLRAGEFSISTRSSLVEIVQILRFGPIVRHKITFAEGLTSAAIIEKLQTSDLLTVAKDLPKPKEGSLLPETYLIERGTSADQLIGRMQRSMKELLEKEWERRAPGLPLNSKEEALILASIVEKETGLASERREVAAVFINRLDKKMRLESDPTIIYGLTKGAPLGRGLRRSEIDRPTPYNTYVISRLPPGPICNPGANSIRAVLNPADSDALFFVADGSGGHAFAKTYAQHQRNVARWRETERERKAAKN